MPESLLTMKPTVLFQQFLQACRVLEIPDVTGLADIATVTIAHLRGSALSRTTTEPGEALLHQWYASLACGDPDWAVYATPYYLAECWACWTCYSRKYLRSMVAAHLLPPTGIVGHLGMPASILDLGCGLGYTSAALCQIFPQSPVYATNLPNTMQAQFATHLSPSYGFTLHATVQEAAQAGCQGGLIFASEYFEHLQDPLTHLQEICTTIQPQAWLIANSFGARAIGHFPTYGPAGHQEDAQKTTQRFSATLKQYGYTKQATKCWNHRPAYWIKKG